MSRYRSAADIAALVQDDRVHRDLYLSEDLYALEEQHFFANTWNYVGHASQVPKTGDYAAVICLGTVIRGETSHYDLVCREAASGVAAVSRDTGVPCIFGVVTTDNLEQAIQRAGAKSGNKGADAALAALEMADLLPRLDGSSKRRSPRDR